MKFQSIESYAFVKSTFHKKPLDALLFHSIIISSAITALSTNCCPGMNVDWKGSTGSLITSLSLLAKTLAMIRYMELESEMGRKSLTHTAPGHFGRRNKYDLLIRSSLRLPVQSSSRVLNTSDFFYIPKFYEEEDWESV